MTDSRGLLSLVRAVAAGAALSMAGCADTGAHLTFSAPEGPRAAASFRVVLATPGTIPQIQGQRVALGNNAQQTVSYYLQRTLAGGSEDAVDQVDGFTVRIAPEADFADTEFIPFVLMYDDAKKIVGIGTYRAGDTPAPSAILVVQDEIDKYTLDVEAVTQVDEKTAPAPGQVQVVECPGDNGAEGFTSGIVWRPLGGGELRVLFPSDGSTDATGRKLDMDCDGHEVTPENSRPDCDDTRSWFHRDAPDVCDGYDTNCDGFQTLATTCTTSTPNTCTDPVTNMPATGLELCDDRTGESLGCHQTATCACLSGAGCIQCHMPYMAGAAQGFARPCQPAIGQLSTYGKCSATAPCTVEVVGTTSGWKIEIAPATSSSFGTRAMDVKDSFVIKAKHPDDNTYEQNVGTTNQLSDVSFSFITPQKTEYVTMRLRLSEDPAVASCPASPMLTCYP